MAGRWQGPWLLAQFREAEGPWDRLRQPGRLFFPAKPQLHFRGPGLPGCGLPCPFPGQCRGRDTHPCAPGMGRRPRQAAIPMPPVLGEPLLCVHSSHNVLPRGFRSAPGERGEQDPPLATGSFCCEQETGRPEGRAAPWDGVSDSAHRRGS